MKRLLVRAYAPVCPELPHERVADLASDYVDDNLSAWITARFRRHLRSCPDCSHFVATLRATVLTLHDLSSSHAPASLESQIRKQLDRERQTRAQANDAP